MLALVLLAVLAAAYAYMHAPLPDDDELHQVALDPADSDCVEIGQLSYLGGIDIPRMGQNVGGISGLRWDEGQFVALLDDGRWMRFVTIEDGQQLIGIEDVRTGDLLGLDGDPLSGKAEGDAEGLTRSATAGWLVSFEREHRIWHYPELDGPPGTTEFDPVAAFGEIGNNRSLETIAGDEQQLFACVERAPDPAAPNCAWTVSGAVANPLNVAPPEQLAALGGLPTDADTTKDGSLFVLFRSYSPEDGAGAGIIALAADGTRRELAVFRPPLTTDNFEGIAVREEGDETFIYIVSDDNFSGRQRTLLMKFLLRSV